MGIELKNLTFSYDFPPNLVLQDVNLKIAKGDVVALMGASGSGKSTLIKMISSFFKPTSGNIFINGNSVELNKPHSSLAYLSQSSQKTFFPWLTVEENIYYPNKLRNNLNSETKNYCNKLLYSLKIEKKSKSFPLKISGGEQKRLSLAIALSYEPEIILLDEPFSGIDFKLTEELWDVLYSYFKRKKPTVLFVTHSLDEASILANKTVFLKNISNEYGKEYFTLFSPDRTVLDFESDRTLPRYKQITNPNIIEYRKYLLNQFNISIQ